jgi:hypothetical protein
VQVQCVAKQFRFNVFGYARPFRPPVNDILIKRELDRNFAKWVLFGHCRVATSQLAHLHGVTGPKTDLWLVKTVAALLSAVGIALIVASVGKQSQPGTICLGLLCALALTLIDIYYVVAKVIRKIYLADGILELIFIALWICCLAVSSSQ